MSNIAKPKHTRIVENILQSISDGKWKVGDKLPSINQLKDKWSVARMTVVNALDELKSRGVIESKDRVGYYVRSENIVGNLKVMLFLSFFDSYHEVLYKEIISGLDSSKVTIDVFFHHCNPNVFRSIIREHLGLYRLYIVTPFRHPSVKYSLEEIPHHRLLQIARPPVIENTSFVSQEFDEELVDALQKVKDRILRYDRFTLIFPEEGKHPEEIKTAFSTFCEDINIPYSIENEMDADMMQNGVAFFTIRDNDLIKVIKCSEEKGFRLGKETGLISYNETPMKEIIRNGVTIVSTDFRQMGREIRRFIETQKIVKKKIPTEVIIRNSL
jgi:DNA-binding transcriptional regulator YhcF (GntR family)